MSNLEIENIRVKSNYFAFLHVYTDNRKEKKEK